MNSQNKYYAANGAILFVIGLGFINLITYAFREDVTPPCNERYANYLMFPENVGVGERISDESIELHLDGDVQGLSQFTRVIHSSGRAPSIQFETRLPKGSGNPRKADGVIGGMGFAWQPELPVKATAACLSYKVWLPKEFKFAKGGTLPGLFGGVSPGVDGYSDPSLGFSENVVWKDRGLPGLRRFDTNNSSSRGRRVQIDTHALPLGRWIKVSQELILNTPGQSDGTSRVWIDDELKHEDMSVMFHNNKKLNISGVLGDVYYEGRWKNNGSPKDTFLRITPFVLNWK